MMFRVIKSGLQTTVQDVKGRKGFMHLGFPPSGAMDSLAMMIANILVGNDANEAGLEFAFSGPDLVFDQDSLVSVTGAMRVPKIDDAEVPMYQSILVKKGQILSLSDYPANGQWGCLGIAGGIDAIPVMNSTATFAAVGLGGYQGRVLKAGDILDTKSGARLDLEGKRLKGRHFPIITEPMVVELMYGYFTDYMSDRDIEMMYSTSWTIQPNSSRLGYRLSGPEFEFSSKAHNKTAGGAFPSNILDCGYPVGAINFAGMTPVILTADGPTCGGFMCPYKIPSGALWKVGQCKLGGTLRFKYVNQSGAKQLREECAAYLNEDYYTI
jgi:urea carboxylase